MPFVFLPFWRIVGDFTAFWLLSYIFILVMLYIVLYACVCALIVMCNFRGHNSFGFGAVGVFSPPFSAFSTFSAFSAFSTFSAHKNFLHLNTA